MARLRRRVRRTRQGTYRVDLPRAERDLLRRLLPQLRALVVGQGAPGVVGGDGPGDTGVGVADPGTPDPDGRTRRLFPVAYASDPDADEEYQALMHDDLVRSRLDAIDVMATSLDATVLDEDQLAAWMASVNSIRLVLGTALDVSEDLDLEDLPPDHPDLDSYALYGYLGFLLEELVQAALD